MIEVGGLCCSRASTQSIFGLIVFCARCAKCAIIAQGNSMRNICATFAQISFFCQCEICSRLYLLPQCAVCARECTSFSNAQDLRKIVLVSPMHKIVLLSPMRNIWARFSQDCTYFSNAQYRVFQNICWNLGNSGLLVRHLILFFLGV